MRLQISVKILFPTLKASYILYNSTSERNALFIWSRVPETTLPLETTLRSVYMEL